jgi:uncharacterized protein GlcG (DUF336 family)
MPDQVISLIVGGTSGIGREIAHALARRGEEMIVTGRDAFAGGLPIMTADNVQIGAIGVSGGTADQDETCAQAGIDGAKDWLK